MIGNTGNENRRDLLTIILVLAACLIPFINKAFHMDDPLFLWCAEQIKAHPFDFYGFHVNWYKRELPMYIVNQNPPFVPYYIALTTLIFGGSEITLHLSFLLPALFMGAGIYYLSRFFCEKPLEASLFSLLTSLFLVSATSVMTDVMMMAFYVWAAVLWLYGIRENRHGFLLGASVLISLSSLSKYYGMSLIPLLFVYTLLVRRKGGLWMLYLILPVGVIGLYQWWANALYGADLVSNAASYALFFKNEPNTPLMQKLITGFSFVGGCMAGVLFFIPIVWPKKYIMAGLVAFALLAILFFLLPENQGVEGQVKTFTQLDRFTRIQLALFVIIGLQFILLAFMDVWHERTPESLFLVLWFFGAFFFSVFLNWSINARSLLPLVPVAGILVIRQIKRHKGGTLPLKRSQFLMLMIPCGLLSMTVAWADLSLADCQRKAARIIQERFEAYPHGKWFQGHWGFQYYMEKAGYRPLDLENSRLNHGEIVIAPSNNTNPIYLADDLFFCVQKMSLSPLPFLGMMSLPMGAGFYTDRWGMLPFAFGKVPPEEYYVFIAGFFDKPEEAARFFQDEIKSGKGYKP